MNAQRWQRLDELFGRALELEPEDRRLLVEGEAGSLPQTIADLGESMDPTEPMQRVRAALELIAAGEAA